MEELKTINTKSKNSMPTFVQTTFANLEKGLADKKVQAPIFGFLTDEKCMVYVDPAGEIHKILVDRVKDIENRLQAMVDPETGEPVNIDEFVDEKVDDKVEPVVEQVDTLTGVVQNIQDNGATIMITEIDSFGGVMNGEY